MTLRFIKQFFFLFCVVFLLVNCSTPNKQNVYSRHALGYSFKLLAFNSDTSIYNPGVMAHVKAVFKTQNDSVFYDSENDLKGNYFVEIDSTKKDNFLKHCISLASEGDSVITLIKTEMFFKQQFNSPVPDFCKSDSVVKIYFKVTRVYRPDEFENVAKGLNQTEMQLIEAFYGSAKLFENARDEMGFFWVERPDSLEKLEKVKLGDLITLSYEGSFLNGRVVDLSPPGFQFTYGTPDQVLKGLNYVIGRLKIGQTSKIILPSQLAFGQNGSSNGSIPPFTPMMYKITISKQ